MAHWWWPQGVLLVIVITLSAAFLKGVRYESSFQTEATFFNDCDVTELNVTIDCVAQHSHTYHFSMLVGLHWNVSIFNGKQYAYRATYVTRVAQCNAGNICATIIFLNYFFHEIC
jgi:hypothetical protein